MTFDAEHSDISNVLATSGATYNEGEGNIDAEPLFVNAAGGDFHLTAGSPVINSGTSFGAPKIDVDGKPRPGGTGYDMGAYEHELAGAPAPTPGGASTPIVGSWSGTDIGFSVSGRNTVDHFSVTFSGPAAGTSCSYHYKSAVENHIPIAMGKGAELASRICQDGFFVPTLKLWPMNSFLQ
ncbi:MAG: DUF5123 domain-containing protein [Gammaproteobacteria bacterium]|jgi:hypothetical protein|nr:DUF5123 domain-containing protein [Gammaproteobacteria bacterium]